MNLPRARAIDELFAQVGDNDLVLTADAPLADALTARVEHARIDAFSTTPRRLVRSARRNTDLLERRGIFVETVKRTDVDWKRAIHAVDAVVDCWTHTGDAEAILDHDRFDTDAVRAVIDVLREVETLYGAMEAHTIDPSLDVAVVGPHRFDALDEKVVPGTHDATPYLTDGTYELPELDMYRSRAGIVRAVTDAIADHRPEDVAVVMDTDSAYPALLESHLDSAGIPYMADRTLDETRPMRVLVMLLRRGFEENLRVQDVRALLPVFDLEVSREYERHHLGRVEVEGADTMRTVLADAVSGTFGDAVDLVADRSGLTMDAVREALDDLDLLDRAVTEERVDHLVSFLSAYDERTDRTRHGVLLASATATAYVDRPVVFYLGLDDGWRREVRDRPWVDRTEAEEEHRVDFATLLQNGDHRYMLVQDRELNRDVTPCIHLGAFTDATIESFRDLPHTRRSAPAGNGADGFVHRERDVHVREETAISQSRLATLATSPKDYYFDQLVTDVDEVYFTRGTLFHDFAEFAINHPGVVEERGVDAFVDVMLDEIRPHLEERQEPVHRTQFRVGCRSILAFLEEQDIMMEGMEGYGPVPWDAENTFATHFDRPITSPVTERWFQDEDLGMQGIVDFIADRTHLVDHKSGGNTPVPQALVRAGHVDRFEDDPDFQAPMYLTHHRTVVPGEPLTFTYFHFLNNAGDAVTGSADVADNIGSVTYLPRPYEEQVTREHTYDYLRSAKVRERLLDPLGVAGYRDAVEALTIGEERWERDAMEEQHRDAFMEACREHLAVGRGEDVTERQLEKGAASVLRQLAAYRQEHFFAPDMDRFEAFVRENLDALNAYKREGFPAGDADRDDLNHPDMVIR